MKQNTKIRTHGRTFVGRVISDVFHKTTTIEFDRKVYVSKYERFQKRKTRIKVHVPEDFKLAKGDMLKIIETRPISKTKNFVAMEVITQ
ncbi:30S ribosomal protein S17 [Candidatus Woesearchaeota archaeon]|jgi:small subunit ribosomal protein S17|nr:30S ribosomal protein S17 [Candidatus Woesearchaeota archaeon]MBT4058117.1 30S ribosomal protein S17 [Candidatus Woesearchaeota archaeon]MBT4208946.1 30S ribosomal protein S17 [Candidatus Woesearchaeota archaeon]MBT4732441.1 30S ribosomal protein S17 [Candidatus Woesearchaeota archaeon]MBT4783028.1 30S ribosomal protein S17 [Candidatus Woesearchaeota archaeon]